MVQNAYIHIPFCRQKCNYCSFVSYPELEKKDSYIKALLFEISERYEGEYLKTIYFGGGTPSLLEIKDFENILGLLKFDGNSEVTVELNPESVGRGYLRKLKELGVNRLSFGCQTFDENILKIIGRKHKPYQVVECVKEAQNVGYNNVSLDFIYGLPAQSVEGFEADLKKAVDLNIQHVSLYGLKIDSGCYFYSHRPDNLPDEDLQADMYLKALSVMRENGFNHYEISNFAKAGFESRHNLNYWDNNSYYGFGVGAHGYTGAVRYSNKVSVNDYIDNPNEHITEEVPSQAEKLEEEIFLGFRKMSGINVEQINRKFSIDFDNEYKNILKKYVDYGYLEKTKIGYRLTDSGILVSNVILADFLN